MNHDLLEVKEEARRLYGQHSAMVEKNVLGRHDIIKSHCKISLEIAKRSNPELKHYWHDLNMEISYLRPLQEE